VKDWFEESLHPNLRQCLSINKVVFEENTGHQKVIIFENDLFGRVLAIDGIVQTTEGDEFIYHEMLSHVPILAHGDVSQVLIIGGGDGGMAREILRYKTISNVTMVELDQSVVNICQTYLPSLSQGAFSDPRLNLIIEDGAEFVKKHEFMWDVIVIDSTDPIGSGEVLFSQNFYTHCKKCLRSGGILVTQNGVPFVQTSSFVDSHKRLSKLFCDVSFYLATIPTYQGGSMAFGFASENKDYSGISLSKLKKRFKAADINTRYYTPEIHLAAFALPAEIQSLME
jgi:spermidine synthase